MVTKHFGKLFAFSMKKRYRYTIFISLFCLFLINMFYIKFNFIITTDFVIDYFKLMASIIGIFLSVVMAFYFILYQDIDNKRNQAIVQLRTKIEEIKKLHMNLPDEFDFLHEPLAISIATLDDFEPSQRLVETSDDDIILTPITDALDEHEQIYSSFTLKENLFIDHLVSHYTRIEEYMSAIGLAYVRFFGLRLMFETILRITFNLAYYLISIIALAILVTNHVEINENILGFMLLFGLISSLFYILQIAIHFIDFYRNSLDTYFDDI